MNMFSPICDIFTDALQYDNITDEQQNDEKALDAMKGFLIY